MNDSLSHAHNGGEDYIFRWTRRPTGAAPHAGRRELGRRCPTRPRAGWTLAAGANDLDGDLLPELYIANDFGPDRLLHNLSTPGTIEVRQRQGDRAPPDVPKSKRLGDDSFKGMGVDFGDLNHDGLYDMFVCNITTSFGHRRRATSHFMNTAKDQADLRDQLAAARRRSTTTAREHRHRVVGLGLGRQDRRLRQQRRADDRPDHRLRQGRDQPLAAAAGAGHGQRRAGGQPVLLAERRATATTSPAARRCTSSSRAPTAATPTSPPQLGLAVPVPTRGIATGDADGDGRLDFAVARQCGEPVFYHNEAPDRGRLPGLNLTQTQAATGHRPVAGSPVAGARSR